jgi:hypothetical protein
MHFILSFDDFVNCWFFTFFQNVICYLAFIDINFQKLCLVT